MALQIVTANRLIDGSVVYFTLEGTWSPWIAEARAMNREQTANAVLALGFASVGRNEVIDPYLIDVVQEAATIKPVRYREAIRAKGPSTHPQAVRMSRYQVPTGKISVTTVAAGNLVTMAFLNDV
jgi:hypothetical protein